MSGAVSRRDPRRLPAALVRRVRRVLVRRRLQRAGRNRSIEQSPLGASATHTGDLGILDPGTTSSISTRFILLSEQRSGSTLFITELGRRWKEIRARREVFNPKRRSEEDSFATIARRTFITETGHPIVGCKIFGAQVTEEQLCALLALPGMRVIILRRRNSLRRHTSQLIAQSTNQWESKVSEPKEPISVEQRMITIDTARFARVLRAEELRFERYEQLTLGVPKMHLTYEELTSDLDGEMRRIATFLGAGEPARESEPRLERQNPEPLSELIRNLDEVTLFLEEIGHPDFLRLGEPDPTDPSSSP